MMNRRKFISKLALTTGAYWGCSQFGLLRSEAQTAQNPMNVLFIFTDDQRFNTIHALNNEHIITPNLDRLAQRSFVFNNAFCFGGNSGAVCIPARNQTMSGQTWFRFGGSSYADPNGPTFPKSMNAAGYETFYREKSGSANLPGIRLQFEHREDIHMVNALRTGRPALGIVNDSIDFISNTRDQNRPFFMYLGFPCPHDPRWSLEHFRNMYNREELPIPDNFLPYHPYDIGDMTIRDECLEAWPRTEEAIRTHLYDYYSLITSMDYDIGRLLDCLDEQGLTDNTLIIFSSDQGLAMGSHGLMGKQNIYDGTMKVPMLFAGPGISPGQSDALVYIHDIFPAVCDMVGTDIPTGIDGISLKSIIDGTSQKVRDHLMLAYKETQRSVRDDRWKLICFPQINVIRFYDLLNDPHEMNDLSDDPAYSAQISQMMTVLQQEQTAYGDTLPLTSTNPDPSEFVHCNCKLPTAYPAGGEAPNGKWVCEDEQLPMDFDGNCKVDIVDLSRFMSSWLGGN